MRICVDRFDETDVGDLDEVVVRLAPAPERPAQCLAGPVVVADDGGPQRPVPGPALLGEGLVRLGACGHTGALPSRGEAPLGGKPVWLSPTTG